MHEKKGEEKMSSYRVAPAATTDQSRTRQGRAVRSIAGAAALALGLLVGYSAFAQPGTPGPQNDGNINPQQSITTVPSAQDSSSDSNQSDKTKKVKLHCNDPDNPDCD
jgi:hypothetical protein